MDYQAIYIFVEDDNCDHEVQWNELPSEKHLHGLSNQSQFSVHQEYVLRFQKCLNDFLFLWTHMDSLWISLLDLVLLEHNLLCQT